MGKNLIIMTMIAAVLLIIILPGCQKQNLKGEAIIPTASSESALSPGKIYDPISDG